MVELIGKPLLHHQIAALRRAGANDITLVGGYRSDRLEGDFDCLELNVDYDSSNMVTTLFYASEHMKDGEDLIVSYGDIVFESRVINEVIGCDAPIVTAIDQYWRKYWELRFDDPLDDAESLLLRDGDYIAEIGRKPRSYDQIQGQYIGLTKIRGDYVRKFIETWQSMDREALYDGQSFDNMYMTSFLQHVIDTGAPIRAAFIQNGWLEIDTTEDLALYEELHNRNELTEYINLGG